jgi:hypothetical protein
MAVHRLTVDTYAVQHPGRPSPQSIQSVAVHLISLCAVLERKLGFEAATSILRAAADTMKFEWLEPPPGRGAVTVAEVARAEAFEDHIAAVKSWAAGAWEAWSPHHAQVREWMRSLETAPHRRVGSP